MGQHRDRIRSIASQPATSVEEAAAQIQALAESVAQVADELAEVRRVTGAENVELRARLRAADHRIEDLERRIQRAAGSRDAARRSASRADGKQAKPSAAAKAKNRPAGRA